MIGELDAVQSLGEMAEAHRYVRPVLLAEPVLRIIGGRHPVIERLMPGGERFVPVDVALDGSDRQILMLTGPNMAGKSTVMRQTALITLFAHMGSFVPADEAQIGLCDRIFTRVGASDHLGEGQSTFMVEMLETATILKHATSQSLVLLDEIGRGTSTYDGVSIAWAVAEHIHDVLLCRTLFATHYHELTALSEEKHRIHNVQMGVVEQNGEIVFLRRLLEGAVGRSYGIEVARLAHLPSTVLSRARQMLASLEQGARPSLQAMPAMPICVPTLDPIREQLRHVDPLRLSPMEALSMLQKLCGEAR
jgi:DNA mismatch repair protein MutS